jgi:ABC-2 type transport system ATP-binding protein
MASHPNSNQAFIQFQDVHKVFSCGLKPPVHALRGMSLAVDSGCVVGILGPNGCGKTTAISCLLGLLHPQAGAVLIEGRPTAESPFQKHITPYGVLLEDTKLPPFLSVSDALATVCALRGMQRSELDRVVFLARIEALQDRRVAALSKGQARRVGLASALIGDPPLLILDEPSAGLDVSAREEFNDLVRGLKNNRRTILIASHLLSDIESTCSHIAIMQTGRIILYRDAESLLREARERTNDVDIMVDQRYADDLNRLDIPFEPSKYPGLLRIVVREPEYKILGRLAACKIVPTRMEPRATLVSLYLETIEEANKK